MLLKSEKNNKTLKPSNFKDVFFPYELVPATRSPLPSNRFLKDLTNAIRIQQGNYSLRRPPKLIISPMFNEQRGYSKKLY